MIPEGVYRKSILHIQIPLGIFFPVSCMAGNAERRGEQLTQLTFDALTAIPSDDARTIQERAPARTPAKRTAEIRRKAKKSASLHNGVTQQTFDALFASMPQEADIPLSPTTREPRRTNGKPGKPTQLSFDALTALPADDTETVHESKPAETGSDSQPIHRPDVRTDNGHEHSIFSRQEERSLPIPATSTERVIFSEPEPEPESRPPSRDFRILPEHQVGVGSPRQKARDNIAAIKLLKTLEAEKRDATNDEKAILVRYAGWGALAPIL